MGKGPGCPGGDPRGNRTAPTGPGCVRSCSQAAMSQRAAPQRRSPVFRRRGPPPGCPRAGRGRGRGRAPTGASQPPLLRAPRGRAASFPTPPLLVFIDRSPSHPPPPLRPTIRFLKSPFVSQEAGEREGERDAEAEGGGGSLPVASDRSGQEGICRRRGRGLFPRPSAGAAEGVGEPPAHGTQRALSPRALDTLGPSSPAGGRSGQPAARAPWAGQTRLSAALAGRGQRGRPLFSFALLPAPLATWALGGCRARGCETTAATLNLSRHPGTTVFTLFRALLPPPPPTRRLQRSVSPLCLEAGRESERPPPRFLQSGGGQWGRGYTSGLCLWALGDIQDLAGPYPLHLPPKLTGPCGWGGLH